MMLTPEPVTFALPAGFRVKVLKTVLRGSLRVRAEKPSRLQRTFFDTFDGRLYAADLALELRVVDGSAELIAQPLSGGEANRLGVTETLPRFGWDIPEGPMRQALAPILGPRALLPQVDLVGMLRRLGVLTPAGETIAHLELRTERPLRFGRRSAPSASLRLIAAPDQEALAAELHRRLVDSLGLTPLAGGEALDALEAGGARPAGQGEGIDVRPEAGMAAENATKQILQAQLATLKLNIPGVCRNLDSEFLHDFRVAVRRIRAALSQLRRALSPRLVERLRREFTWLGQLTSNARDLDVFLLAFDDYQKLLPAELQASFAPLRPLLEEIRDREYQVLREALRGHRFGRLLRQFRSFLGRPLGKRPLARDAARPIGVVAPERIWALYGEAIEEGAAIGPQSHLDELHELRKTCKKLRYLMEFFCPLFPQAEILGLIGVLKRFQDNLGEIQDLRVQRESLAIYAHQIGERHTALARTQEAIAWLSDHLGERQQLAREAFQARFAAFALEENRDRFQALFGPGSEEKRTQRG